MCQVRTAMRGRTCEQIVEEELARRGGVDGDVDGGGLCENLLWSVLVGTARRLNALHDRRLLHRGIRAEMVHVVAAEGPYCEQMLDNVWLALPLPGDVDGAYDNKAEVFAFACVLYELGTLRTFDPAAPSHGPSPLPSTYSLELQFLLAKMLDADPGRRPDMDQIMRYSAVKIRIERDELYRGVAEREAAARRELDATRAAVVADAATARAQVAEWRARVERMSGEFERERAQLEAELAAVRVQMGEYKTDTEAIQDQVAQVHRVYEDQVGELEHEMQLVRDLLEAERSENERLRERDAGLAERERQLDAWEQALVAREHTMGLFSETMASVAASRPRPPSAAATAPRRPPRRQRRRPRRRRPRARTPA